MTLVSYAQNFEDVILWRALHDVEHGRYVDIGANDPVIDSVSKAFYDVGWRGIHVEPTPAYATRLREARPDEIVIEAAVTDASGPIDFYEVPQTGLSTGVAEIAFRHAEAGYAEQKIIVPCVRLDNILAMAGSDTHWLKVDVEGMEADVLRSWGNAPQRPWILVVEATYPNSQEPTTANWIQEVIGRGYQEVHFDGLSCYFLHEAQAHRASRFAAPPNVFDGFQVARTHFSARLVNEAAADEMAKLRGTAELREQQLTHEIADLRLETKARSDAMGEMELARTAATEALAASEREHRAFVDRSWRDRQESEDALRRGWSDLENGLRGQLVSTETRLRKDGAELAALRERAAQLQGRIDRLLEDRAAARQSVTAHRERIEELRHEGHSLRERLAQQSERADRFGEEARAAGEEAVKQSKRIEQLGEDREAALQHNALLENELASLQDSFRDLQDKAAGDVVHRDQQLASAKSEAADLRLQIERSIEVTAMEKQELFQQLAQSRATTAEADRIIRDALAEPLDRWQRLGRALALSRGDGSRRALRSWEATPTLDSVETMCAYTCNSVTDPRSPYFRANSLSELLAWHDIDFVRCAYVTVLGRVPDAEGEAHYTHWIRLGATKLEILGQMRRSSEGRSFKPNLANLDQEIATASRARMPIFGKLFPDSKLEPQRRTPRPFRILRNRLERLNDSIDEIVAAQAETRSEFQRLGAIYANLGQESSAQAKASSRVITVEHILEAFQETVRA